jgi:type IV secretion system protein TrbG
MSVSLSSKLFRMLTCLVMLGVALGGCTMQPTHKPMDFTRAVPVKEPPKPIEVVEVPKVLPLPGQLKPAPSPERKATTAEARDPQQRVVQANAAARVEPRKDNFVNATQVWPYSADALYQLYASPERITDIALQEGEDLISVSAGDTVRWVIGDTTSGSGATQRVHILVKPTREDLQTNLVIHSNRRSYHLELTATPQTWMASVSWDYPLDRLATLRRTHQQAEAAAPVADSLSIDRLNFHYTVTGDSPVWKPLRAFDDGAKVYIQFPAESSQGELPPLFVVSTRGDAQLVNYRVRSPYYIVDRLFSTAELRLGGEKDSQVVRISRVDARTPR